MSSSPTIFRHLLDTRLLGAAVGILLGVVAAYHGWPGGLVLFVTGLGLLFLAQWMERNAHWAIRRIQGAANTAD